MRLACLKFGFCFCLWKEEASGLSLSLILKAPCLPTHPPTHFRGRRQGMASWCLELTQVQRLWGVGGTKNNYRFLRHQTLPNTSAVVKTALYGESVVKRNNCKRNIVVFEKVRGCTEAPGYRIFTSDTVMSFFSYRSISSAF